MMAFKPKGELPEWRLIYDKLLQHADFGDVITYEMLEQVLGRPFEENRSPFYRAREEMGSQRLRWAESVPGEGYRVIQPNEHMHAAQARKRRAQRQLRAMVKIGEVTDLTRLTPEELMQFDSQTRFNRAVYMAVVSHEKRLTRIEELLRADGKL